MDSLADGVDPAEPVARECVEAYLYTGPPWAILLLQRPPARGSIWVPVSGKVEPEDVDLEAAIRRELEEETGLAAPSDLASLDWHVRFRADDGTVWRLHAYAVRVAPGFAPRLSPEHVAFEWAQPSAALTRLHYPDNREAVHRLVERLERRSPND